MCGNNNCSILQVRVRLCFHFVSFYAVRNKSEVLPRCLESSRYDAKLFPVRLLRNTQIRIPLLHNQYPPSGSANKICNDFCSWLDAGEGKDLDLPGCSREQLDKERVMYLNAEQRRNYLITVGKDGQLYWKRNGRKLDTAKGRWEDLGGGRGIGRKGEKDNLPPPPDPAEDTSSGSSASSLYSSSDSGVDNTDDGAELRRFKKQHYHQKPDDSESKHSYWTSPRAVMDVLLRKTINSNTWIYVADTQGNLYVGIKSTGGFQHSSFMFGATVASAGLLKCKDGQLTSLDPLSGHYRAGSECGPLLIPKTHHYLHWKGK